jgi:imidazolonepropionase-like amidohydrolase
LYIANGVTGLREMAASVANSAKQKRYQSEMENGIRVGPRLVWTIGPTDRQQAANAEKARAAVRDIKASGASFVKIYNDLSREAYMAIVHEAVRYDMPVTGHVPDTVRWSEAIAAGQRSIEHLDGMLLTCTSRELRGSADADEESEPH